MNRLHKELSLPANVNVLKFTVIRGRLNLLSREPPFFFWQYKAVLVFIRLLCGFVGLLRFRTWSEELQFFHTLFSKFGYIFTMIVRWNPRNSHWRISNTGKSTSKLMLWVALKSYRGFSLKIRGETSAGFFCKIMR